MVASVDNAVARGANPTGVSNSAPAIQAALDTDGACYIPAGVYRIDTGLTLGSGQTLFGEGMGDPQVSGEVGTVLKGNGLSGPLLTVSATSHAVVENLNIQDAPVGIQVNTSTQNSKVFRNIKISGCTRGVQSSASSAIWMSSFQNIQVMNPLVGFDFTAALDNTTLNLMSCHVVNLQSGGTGFFFNGGVSCPIVGCSVTGVTTTNAYAIRGHQQAWSLPIVGFLFRDNACGIIELRHGLSSASMLGGYFDTDRCTAGSPPLFDIEGGDFVATGIHVAGAQNYPTICNEGGRAVFQEPKPNLRSFPGMPAGVKILFDGAYV
jgi:hypothetical protein